MGPVAALAAAASAAKTRPRFHRPPGTAHTFACVPVCAPPPRCAHTARGGRPLGAGAEASTPSQPSGPGPPHSSAAPKLPAHAKGAPLTAPALRGAASLRVHPSQQPAGCLGAIPWPVTLAWPRLPARTPCSWAYRPPARDGHSHARQRAGGWRVLPARAPLLRACSQRPAPGGEGGCAMPCLFPGHRCVRPPLGERSHARRPRRMPLACTAARPQPRVGPPTGRRQQPLPLPHARPTCGGALSSCGSSRSSPCGRPLPPPLPGRQAAVAAPRRKRRGRRRRAARRGPAQPRRGLEPRARHSSAPHRAPPLVHRGSCPPQAPAALGECSRPCPIGRVPLSTEPRRRPARAPCRAAPLDLRYC